MRNISKQVLTVLLSAALVLSFVACGGGTTPAPSAEASASSEQPASSSKAEPETPAPTAGTGKAMQFWHIQNTEPMKTIVGSALERYNAANPEFPVEITAVTNDSYKEKIVISMGANTAPDIYTHWTGGPLIEYVKSGHALDITEYMDKDNFKDKFQDAAVAQATYEGKIYSVPVENVAVAGVYYNKTLFAEHNLAVPTTLTEFEAVCDTLVSAGIYPFSLANATKWTGSMYYMSLATRYGGLAPFTDAASGTGSFESETFVYAGTKLQEWVNKGYFNEGFNGLDEDSGQSRQQIYQGKAAMQVIGSFRSGTFISDNREFYEENMAWFPFPVIEGKEEYGNLLVGTIGDNNYSVSPACATPEKAFEAITYLLDDTAVDERIKLGGKIPPLKGIEDRIEDPILKQVMETVGAAGGVQLWYDQYLPPEVAEAHKSTSQEIFGLTLTPEEANAEWQKAMDAYLAK